MKKLFIFFGLIGVCFLNMLFTVNAEQYQNYQEIVFDNDEAKLLKHFTDNEYTKYYNAINKRRFIGWNISIVNKNEPVEFVSETKLKIYNNGFSTIAHNISLETKEETKFQISVSGGVKASGSGSKAKFKGSLDAEIKSEVSYSSIKTKKESYEFKITVDPKTYVKIITRGKGEISNGVGKSYFFWIETGKGGWETFTVQTEYYEIIKDRIQ